VRRTVCGRLCAVTVYADPNSPHEFAAALRVLRAALRVSAETFGLCSKGRKIALRAHEKRTDVLLCGAAPERGHRRPLRARGRRRNTRGWPSVAPPASQRPSLDAEQRTPSSDSLPVSREHCELLAASSELWCEWAAADCVWRHSRPLFRPTNGATGLRARPPPFARDPQTAAADSQTERLSLHSAHCNLQPANSTPERAWQAELGELGEPKSRRAASWSSAAANVGSPWPPWQRALERAQKSGQRASGRPLPAAQAGELRPCWALGNWPLGRAGTSRRASEQ